MDGIRSTLPTDLQSNNDGEWRMCAPHWAWMSLAVLLAIRGRAVEDPAGRVACKAANDGPVSHLGMISKHASRGGKVALLPLRFFPSCYRHPVRLG